MLSEEREAEIQNRVNTTRTLGYFPPKNGSDTPLPPLMDQVVPVADYEALQELLAERTELKKEIERLEAERIKLLDNLNECWKFDNHQQHTHSWHDKQDFLNRWRNR